MSSPPELSIVFLDRSAIRTELRPPRFPHRWTEHPTTPADAVADRLNAQSATVAIVNRAPITADTVRRVPTLKLVAVCATGYDTVDVAACREAGIAVCNVRNWSSAGVAEHAFAMILSLRRQLFSYHSRVVAGEWGRQPGYGMLAEPLPRTLDGSTMAIVGHGGLGKRIAGLAKAFGMEVLLAERKGVAECRDGRVLFGDAVRQADVLVLACPLTDDTRGMVGEEELRSMKPTSIVINVARGGILDEAALARALKEGRIYGAGLDVLETEPPRNGSPLFEQGLNAIVTPHMGWCSVETLALLGERLIENIEKWAAGEPQNLVS
ncbi:D-isomer-specific 2-hydroxyacid dehydrogenase NAD-binding protein [Hyaloraphidium curvatum]|nr:D-isomer-specific 2-hydroxyacid dehydrogenase NAD-binding protein [Hyaloraphidium curvatum]